MEDKYQRIKTYHQHRHTCPLYPQENSIAEVSFKKEGFLKLDAI